MTDNSKRIRQQAVDWALCLSETASPTEKEEFDRWLAADPAHAEAYRRVAAVLDQTHIALAKEPAFTRKAFRRGKGPGKIIVAVLLLTVSGSLIAVLDVPTQLRADLMTAKTELRTEKLPDGSTIHMNSDTAIALSFSNGRRRIDLLKGEAYFEVARSDTLGAFEVATPEGAVTALGTAFDVNLLESGFEVTVTESRVAVHSDATKQRVVLDPGKRIIVDDAGIGPEETVPAEFQTPWRNGRLVFDDRPLSEVVTQIFRHIPGRVITLDPRLNRKRITGSFNLTDGNRALDDFADAFGLRIARTGKFLTIIY
ncbi:DUF4880 domain-containing protein [Agrobacterium tumefaciens]|uniref:FecR family protein n=1 Tax=Agrobacterium tumefaciens TaxID=358 RepID=UPI001573C5C0|nr:FecR domain-containing protein [Agrobacterium tumefaciens]NSX85540.1 DUF4880 domain-containing protein [Agrobacterium tumefaciens]